MQGGGVGREPPSPVLSSGPDFSNDWMPSHPAPSPVLQISVPTQLWEQCRPGPGTAGGFGSNPPMGEGGGFPLDLDDMKYFFEPASPQKNPDSFATF